MLDCTGSGPACLRCPARACLFTDVLMLERFDREWNPQANAYWRHGLISGLTVLDAEDGYLGRERWSYPLLADELRRWSVKHAEDRRELYPRMVFNAMVTNNDDRPRNHALLHTAAAGGSARRTTSCPCRRCRSSGGTWRWRWAASGERRASTTCCRSAKLSGST
jgi:hypothetical protein